MTTNLPPQAYTRDTLVKAIEWLHTQPQAVRERATSADLLVNIYLQARRRAAVQMEAPVSGETFKTDLKHLAEDLKQFEEPIAPPPQTGRSHSTDHGYHAPVEPLFKHAIQQQQHPQVQVQVHTHAQAVQEPTFSNHNQQAQAQVPPHQGNGHHVTHQYHPPQHHPPQPKPNTWHVDGRSMAAAREIQQRFNLSSEGEALRLLIQLGTERARDLFP